MTGRDRKRELRDLYAPPRHPVLIEVPELAFIAVDGVGAPDEGAEGPTTDFQQSIGALYPVAYTLKFMLRRELGVESTVMPLEALWYATGGDILDPTTQPSSWAWRSMMAVADELSAPMVERAIEEAGARHPNPMLAKVKFERWQEGLAVQIMHVGAYSAERPTIERMRAFMSEHALAAHGAHHEIYLGDPRRAAPEKLRTALRQPVAPVPILVPTA